MPAYSPAHETTASSGTTRGGFTRAAAAAGLTAVAIATALAFPATAQAAPDLAEQLETVTADYDAAKDTLEELTADKADASDAVTAAQQVIDATPRSVTEAAEAVSQAAGPLERLSELTDYGSDQSTELSQALQSKDDNTERIDAITEDIAEQKDLIDELADERDDLKDRIEAEEAEESDSQTDSGESGATSEPASVSANGSGAVEFAKAQLGDPYVFGAAGPDSYDCSGLTSAAWAAAGETIGRDTYAQWDGTTHISRSELQPGDLVFYNGQGHVGLYAGNGEVIHAPTSGDVVKISDIDMMPIDGYTRP